MVTKIAKLPLANQPGEVWEYSAGVDVLGRIIDVVSGMDLERFIEEVESARAPGELSQTLHRFEAFLETLFGQVNMRAVLDGHPFDPNSIEE